MLAYHERDIEDNNLTLWFGATLLNIVDKADGSFSRSRSSSISSLENVSKEAITAVVFADAYCRKTGECCHCGINFIEPRVGEFLLWVCSRGQQDLYIRVIPLRQMGLIPT